MDNGLTGPVEIEGYLRVPGQGPGPRSRGRRYAVLAAAGLLALAATVAGAWPGCPPAGCAGAEPRGWWLLLAVGTAMALTGLAGWSRRPAGDPSDRWRAAPVLVEVLVAVAVLLVLLPVLTRLQLLLLGRATVSFAGAVLLAALLAWWAAAALHGWLAGGTRAQEAVVGTVAAAAAGTAWAGIVHGAGALAGLLPGLPVLWAVALAATVVAVRVPRHRVPTALVAGAAAALALVTTVSTGAYLLPAWAGPDLSVQPSPQEPVTVPSSAPTPVPGPGAGASSGPAPATGGASGSLCTAATLLPHLGTPVPGGHDVATTITVTNQGGQPCRVEGWPSVRLLSDGEDLALFVHVANVNPATGEHVEEVPVVLAPGGAATTQVWWKAHGAAADLQAGQELHLGVGGTEVSVPLAQHDSWDVVRGAEAWVAPWQDAGPDRDGDPATDPGAGG